MGDLGLSQAYGNDALYRLLAQRKAEALQQQQQQFRNNLDTRKLDQQDTLARLKVQELADAAQARAATARGAQQDRQIGLANNIAEQIPGGTFLPESDQAVGMLRTGGRGSLLTPQAAQPALPEDFQGPLPPGQTRDAMPAGFLKTATANQQKEAAAEQARSDELRRQIERDKEIALHDRAMENKPQPGALITVQTVDDNGQPVTRVVPKQAGASYVKGPSAVTQNRLDSAQAVKQTGEDIIAQLSDPQFKAVVGPALGRAGRLRDFIGNPPPEFSKLAGQIESYALANMGVHGMRSAQGAQQIAHLLDAHHTPESLIAAIQGLNGFSQHFLENAGRGGNTSSGGGKRIRYDLNGNPIKE